MIDDAVAWIQQDPDPETRSELEALVVAAQRGSVEAADDLSARFAGRLEFGTAGLRAALGPGPMRMNRVVVAQAAAGLGRFLRASGRGTSVVIGYDGRVNSDIFARDSAEILAGAGLAVTLLPGPLPTPVLAFAVRHLSAGAGVMVTASHNPPRDNGYKVYLGGADEGSQIVPPADQEIAHHIAEVATGDIRDLPRSADYRVADDDLVASYVAATASIVERPAVAVSEQPKVIYTAMHGVGWSTLRRVFDRAGFAQPLTVPEQIDPDGSFPTVPFPNPEEPGAMDLALAAASSHQADLVLANDPDADRLAVAIPSHDGYRVLSGNEVGWLLGWEAAERAAVDGPPLDLPDDESDASADAGEPDSMLAPATLAASIVSAPALRSVADHYGLRYRDTLTGFKWVSRVPGLVFGYEEALGYLVDPDVVRDKDGISAALAVMGLATTLRARGQTLGDRLAAFASTFGAFASAQVSVRVDDLGKIERTMQSLRAEPPADLGGLSVNAVTDYLPGVDDLPSSDILRWDLDQEARVIVRPSGTEPKLKVYIDVRGTDRDAANELVQRIVAAVTPLVDN